MENKYLQEKEIEETEVEITEEDRIMDAQNTTVPEPEKEEEKIYVSIDTSVEDVLRLEKEGKELYFETGLRFNKLSPNVVKELGAMNRMRYNQAFVETQYEEEEKPTPALDIRPRFATAKSRTDVVKLVPDIETCWKRPEDTRYAQMQGYEFAIEGKHVRTFAGKDGEVPTIGKAGDPELILMYLPKEKHLAIIREVERKSQRRNGAVEEGTRSALDSLGGQSFGDSNDDRNWKTLNK